MMKAMEKLKHLDPKFSLSIERLAKRIKYSSDGSLSKRPRTKTANRFHKKAKNDDPTEHNRDFELENDHSISQDRTEYIAKQSDLVPDGFELASNSYYENEFDKHSKSHFQPEDSYNLKAAGKIMDSHPLATSSFQKRQKSIKKGSIPKLPNSNFKVIEQNDLNNPNIDEKQRKEMITVLRNNSKILTQQERSLNSKIQRIKNDDSSRSHFVLSENKLNKAAYLKQGDVQKQTDSGSKGNVSLNIINIEYNDSRYKPKTSNPGSRKGKQS